MIILDLEKFTHKIDKTIRRYRMLYDLLEFFAVALIVLLMAVFFNLEDIFKLIPLTEPYVGLSPNLPLLSIPYEILFLFVIICLLSVLLTVLFAKNRTKIYKLFNKTSPRDRNSKDLVEHTYPELKDRLKTAYDHRHSENIIAAELTQSVTSDVDGVARSDLLDKRRLAYSLCTIFMAGLVLMLIFFTGFTAPISPGDLLDKFPNSSIIQPPISEDNPSLNNSSSIPTDIPPISTEPGVDIDVTLPPGAGMGPGDLLEGETENIFTPSDYYPPESLSSQHYYDILPPGYKDVVKDYFKKLAEQN